MIHRNVCSRVVVTALALLVATTGAWAADASGRSAAGAPAAYGNLSLHFERNDGQAAPEFRFVARGSGYGIALSDSAASIAVRVSTADSSPAVVTMRPVGALLTSPVGVGALPGIANYLIGTDASRWVTNVPTYSKVAYRSVYPGIDLVFYGNRSRAQYDFVLSPGAKADRIRVAYGGVGKVSVAATGELVLQTPAGELRQAKPYAYQTVGGRRVQVAARFDVRSDNTVGFALGRYDTCRQLVIDPSLAYSTFLGAGSDDGAQAVASDSAGCAYVASWTNSAAFPTTGGAFDTSFNGSYDVVLTKLNASGTAVVYSTFLGGAGFDYPSAVAVRSNGNAVVVGDTDSANFPVTAGAAQTAIGGGSDCFVTEVNSTGTALVASTFVGGGAYDTARGVALDTANDRVCIGGWSTSTNYPTTAGAFQTSVAPGLPSAVIVTVLDAALASFHYSTYLAGAGQEQYGTGVAVDSLGQVAVVGRTNSATFPATAGAYQTTVKGESDAFAALLNTAGSNLVWCSLYGGLWTDGAEAVQIDANGNVCFSGRADSNDLPMRGAWQGFNAGRKDAFFAAFEPGGAMIHWGTYFGGSEDDQAYTLTKDAAGYMYITGETMSTDFPVTGDAYQAARAGLRDAIILRIQPTGAGVFVPYATYFGGTGWEASVGAAVDGANGLYVSGWTTSADYPTTAGTVQTTYGGGSQDGFVAKFIMGAAVASKVTVQPAAGVIAGSVNLSAVLQRVSDNGLLQGKTLDFTVEGSGAGSGVTNVSGQATVAYVIPEAVGVGAKTIEASFAGDAQYTASSNTGTLTVGPANTSLHVLNRTGTVTEIVTLRAYLSRVADSAWVVGRTVDFEVDGTPVGSGVTDVNGRADKNYVVPAGPATRPIYAEFAGDPTYNGSNGNATLTAIVWATKMAPFSRTARITDKTELKVRLLRSDDVPVYQKSINMYVDGSFVIARLTDINGYASHPNYYVPDGAGAGVRTITYEWLGDAGYLAKTSNGTLTVQKAIPYIWVLQKTVPLGSKTSLYSYFRRLYDYQKQAGKSVTWRIDGTPINTMNTDANGVASFPYQTTEGVGTHVMRCEFAGDAWLDAGYGEANLNIY